MTFQGFYRSLTQAFMPVLFLLQSSISIRPYPSMNSPVNCLPV